MVRDLGRRLRGEEMDPDLGRRLGRGSAGDGGLLSPRLLVSPTDSVDWCGRGTSDAAYI